MPTPSFPEELVLIIFEHLYRLLCVNPAKEHLDDPIAHDLVFSRLALVSKAWHRLATPFLHRHFSTNLFWTHPAAAHRILRSGSARSMVQTDTVVDLDTWDAMLGTTASTLECLRLDTIPLWVDELEHLAYLQPPMEMTKLREICLNLSYDFDLASLECIADYFPALVMFVLKTTAALVHDYLVDGDRLAMRGLRSLRLDLQRSSTHPYHLVTEFVPTFISESRDTLERVEIYLPIGGLPSTQLSFRDLIPHPFPHVKVLRCTGYSLDCSGDDFFSHFPALEVANISIPRGIPSFHRLPPSLHSLHLSEAPRDNFADYADAILAALDSGLLAQLRTFGVDLHKDHRPCDVSAAPRRALVEAFSSSPILFHATWLAEELPDDTISTLPQLAAYSAPVMRLPDDSDDEAVEEMDAGALGTATARLGEDEAKTVGQHDAESSGQSETMTELDWDAEDWDMFAEHWSDEKRAERGLGAAGDEVQSA
ncbi:hypothetical protein JCM10207_006960 [Rhodosporidiobolus poonsookiae]